MTISAALDDVFPAEPYGAPPRRPWHERIGAATVAPSTLRPLLAVSALAAMLAAGLGWRASVVAAVPETGALYAALGLPVNLRGLELREVRSMVFRENGVELLIVQGDIANVAGRKRIVPPLKFIVRDARGSEIYAWAASADVAALEAGAKATFRRRLASPPGEAADVIVRFAGRAD